MEWLTQTTRHNKHVDKYMTRGRDRDINKLAGKYWKGRQGRQSGWLAAEYNEQSNMSTLVPSKPKSQPTWLLASYPATGCHCLPLLTVSHQVACISVAVYNLSQHAWFDLKFSVKRTTSKHVALSDTLPMKVTQSTSSITHSTSLHLPLEFFSHTPCYTYKVLQFLLSLLSDNATSVACKEK